MARLRSFAEFVKEKCLYGLCDYVQPFVDANWQSLGLYSRRVPTISHAEYVDTEIQRVYVNDLPGTRLAFEVVMQVEIAVSDTDHHRDADDECYQWIRVYCEGDLACGLDDWKPYKAEPYDKKNAPLNSLSDALVPYIRQDQLDNVATEFLKKYYPEALRVPQRGERAVAIDPQILAQRMGLSICTQRIEEDASVFGQIYFADCDTEMFDVRRGVKVPVHVGAKTIVVDPEMFLLRNLGSVNNTIVHECVHWEKHRKVFELERLYNESAANLTCKVVGGAAADLSKSATEMMERQANQLAPRIQMPAGPFKVKASEYLATFMRASNASHENEVMENVIEALATDFVVSRQAAKIRMVELGFESAIGTFTYVDGHYVKPHGFRKGSLQRNQTFTISAQDAAIERFINPALKSLTNNGDFLFLDNHFVFNAPLYVEADSEGELDLTPYARSHMDECCLAFNIKIRGNVSESYHTECFLNREYREGDITFELTYHNGWENSTNERRFEMRQKQMDEELSIRKRMTDDPEQCIELLLEWRNTNYTELGKLIGRDPKTISRTINGKTNPQFDTAALICFGLKLPPIISEKLLEVLKCKPSISDARQQWINEALRLKYPEPLKAVKRYLAQCNVFFE